MPPRNVAPAAHRIDFKDADAVRLDRAPWCHVIVRANPNCDGVQLWAFGRDGSNSTHRASTRVSIPAEAARDLIEALRESLEGE